MTCRHRAGDPACSSYRGPQEEIRLLQKQIDEQKRLLKQPDNSQFEIIDCFEMTNGLVLKVKYDDCPSCSYEGTKLLVYVGSTTRDVLKWRVIDPHFSDKPPGPREAPSPTARFPASQGGWDMAVNFLMRIYSEVER
jgi:hypothetical protein